MNTSYQPGKGLIGAIIMAFLAVWLPSSAIAQALKITSLTFSNRNVGIQWEGGDPNRPYQLQKQSALGGTWSDVDAPVFGTSLQSAFSEQTAFYRVIQNSAASSLSLFDQDA